jgi:hypothetical protein
MKASSNFPHFYLYGLDIFSLLHLLWKNKSKLMRSPCCCVSVRVPVYICVCVTICLYVVCLCIPPIDFWMPEPIFMKIDTYIMPNGHLNGLLHKFLPPVCVCIYIPLELLGNGSVKTLQRQWIRNNRKFVGRVTFHAICTVSKKPWRLFLLRTLFKSVRILWHTCATQLIERTEKE